MPIRKRVTEPAQKTVESTCLCCHVRARYPYTQSTVPGYVLVSHNGDGCNSTWGVFYDGSERK